MKKDLFKKLLPFIKLIMVFSLSISFFVGLYFLLQKTGWIGKFSNVSELKILILSAGFWSYFVYAFIQFLQVTILPIPSMVTTVVGVIIFGPVIAFLISVLSILLGSILAYLLGKFFGMKLLYFAIGKEKTLNLQKKLEKGKFIFFIMMLFPLFPDDILCMMAGVINLNFKFFLITNLITRPLGLFTVCFISSGSLIPFNTFGLIIFILICITLLILFLTLLKNKVKVENFINVKILKNK